MKTIRKITASELQERNVKKRTRLRVAAYCRVSTDQEQQLGSFENQIHYYTELIAKNPEYEFAGIYADEGITGTSVKKRKGFQRLIKDCEAGKIDLILAKSISRFARNTIDSLKYARKLSAMNIGIQFEKEGFNTLENGGELMYTIYSCMAQEEFRNISENTSWGIRHMFSQGISRCPGIYGYDNSAPHVLTINKEQAVIVKRIFAEYLNGYTACEIANRLNEELIPGIHGVSAWDGVSINRMLENERYKGDALLQKYYSESYLTKRTKRNLGKYDQYYVEQDHEAIVSKEIFEAVQLERARRKDYLRRHGIHTLSTRKGSSFTNHIFCSKCGSLYVRYRSANGKCYYKCSCRKRNDGKRGGYKEGKCRFLCDAPIVSEDELLSSVQAAWNYIRNHRKEYERYWSQQFKDGNILQRYRSNSFKQLLKTQSVNNEIIKRMLDEITINSESCMRIAFLDGTELDVMTK